MMYFDGEDMSTPTAPADGDGDTQATTPEEPATEGGETSAE